LWGFDSRGRRVSENKYVLKNGQTSQYHQFTSAWTYYNDDQVKTMTYPNGEAGQTNGEVVSYDYQPQGALKSVSGTDVYANSLLYNAAGQIEQLSLGGLQTVDYNYYPWSSLNGGSLQQITAGSFMNLNYTYRCKGTSRVAGTYFPLF
jgi:hypothetical protein